MCRTVPPPISTVRPWVSMSVKSWPVHRLHRQTIPQSSPASWALVDLPLKPWPICGTVQRAIHRPLWRRIFPGTGRWRSRCCCWLLLPLLLPAQLHFSFSCPFHPRLFACPSLFPLCPVLSGVPFFFPLLDRAHDGLRKGFRFIPQQGRSIPFSVEQVRVELELSQRGLGRRRDPTSAEVDVERIHPCLRPGATRRPRPRIKPRAWYAKARRRGVCEVHA